MSDARWLRWIRRIASLAQNGLAYTEGVFDRERYEELRRLAAEMLAAHAGGEPEAHEALLAREEGYATPKVDVRGVVFEDDRVLLVKEREDGLWTLPGGWADAGESPSEAVAKEVREESGYEVRPVKLLAVHDRERHGAPPLPWSVYKLFLLCERTGGEPAGGLETEAVGFFAEDALPPLSTGRVTAGQLRRMFEHRRHPGWPTDFD